MSSAHATLPARPPARPPGALVIEIEGVTKLYQMGEETIHALRGVSLKIHRNEYLAIMGPSGSGKSTMMNMLGCLDTPTAGRYEFNGKNVAHMVDDELAEIRDVYAATMEPDLVDQYEREFARYSAEELVAMIRKHAGNAASYQRADQALDHAQTKALGVVREVPAAGGAIVRVRAFPARFSGMQPELKGNAPSIGEHTAAVAAELRG